MNSTLKNVLKLIAGIVALLVVFRLIGMGVEWHYLGTCPPFWKL